MAKKVYAVKKGITTGIFNTWDECKRQVHGFPGAQYKSFPTLKEAQEYLTGGQTGDAAPDENDPDVCVAYVDGTHEIHNLHLYYDYQGIESWATGEWKRNKPGTIRYKEFYDHLQKVKVYFHKVKGHSGVELNEAVDQLAKAALGIRG